MVRFEKDKMVIEFSAAMSNPVIWVTFYKEMLMLMRNITQDTITEDFWVICDFMYDMLPDNDTAMKMQEL
jgi:hypothetical protein